MQKTVSTKTQDFIRFWLVPVGIALVVLFIYKALTGLILIGISIFLALALRPLVQKVNSFLNRHFGKKKHRTASAVLAYLLIVVAIGVIIVVVGPVLINETAKFIEQLPTTIQEKIGGWDGINNFGKTIGIADMQSEITRIATSLGDKIFGNFGTTFIDSVSGFADIIMKIVLVLVMTLLFLLEGPNISKNIWSKLGTRQQDKKPVEVAHTVVSKMCNVISTYVSHQVIIAMIDGLASMIFVYILSFIFNFSSSLAIPMGMTTMIFYLIPMFGQFIGGGLVSLILLFSNPIAAVTFIAIYIVYAQIENNAIAPKIQGSALHLPAIAILAAMTIGMYMFGLLGAIVAIPVAGCIRVLIDEYPNIKSARDNNNE